MEECRGCVFLVNDKSCSALNEQTENCKFYKSKKEYETKWLENDKYPKHVGVAKKEITNAFK